MGRSTSLCNIAYGLNKIGKKVFLTDFDIESSGLYAILKRDYAPSDGMIFQNVLCADSVSYIEEIVTSSVVDAPKSDIKFVPAGVEYDATRRVNDLMSHDRSKVFKNVEEYIDLIERKYNPDFLFFDSRAGISNMAEPAFTFSDIIVITYRMGIQQLTGVEGLVKWLVNYFLQIGRTDVRLYMLCSNVHPDASSAQEIDQFVDSIESIKNEELRKAGIDENMIPITKYGVIWQNDVLNKNGSMVLFNHKDVGQFNDILENYLSLAEKMAR